MPSTEQRPYLSDVIDYDRDIAPHRFIKIFAGVGSGKNTFVDNLIKGNVLRHSDGSFVSKKYVLLITSRRAKVNEQLRSDAVVYDPEIGIFDSEFADWMADLDSRYEDYYESPRMKLPDLDGFGRSRVYKRTCINTNAKIEHNLRKNYTPFDARSHPWERFDMIIIDEVHALLADASYQTAPFYVRRLIEETLAKQSNCKVIVMTGSPQILESDNLFANAHCIDLMDVCKNIRPQRIEFITKEDAKQKQLQMLQSKDPFVAFFNHINDALALADNVHDDDAMSVAVSFTDKAKRDRLQETRPRLYETMCKTELHLANHQKLPATVTAFLTTAKNKEGINIKNDSFKTMFVEAHNEIDVIQMVGRLRTPIETLYIVIDSVAHHDIDSRYEQSLAKDSQIIPAINDYFIALCKENGLDLDDEEDTLRTPTAMVEPLGAFIDFIHGKFPYVRYDYFTDRFTYYEQRELSKAYYGEQEIAYRRAKKSRRKLIRLVGSWYPGIPCTVIPELPEDIQEAVDEYLQQNHWLNSESPIRGTERTEILARLNQITGGTSRQLKTLLASFGYALQTSGHRTDSPSVITRINE